MAETYSIYFGTTSGNLSLIQSGLEATEVAVPDLPLEYNTTYYWRVDATNEYYTTTGDEWSFTTIVFDPPAVSVDGSGNPTGENNMYTVRRLAAVANNKFWYEDV